MRCRECGCPDIVETGRRVVSASQIKVEGRCRNTACGGKAWEYKEYRIVEAEEEGQKRRRGPKANLYHYVMACPTCRKPGSLLVIHTDKATDTRKKQCRICKKYFTASTKVVWD
ncbi:MAG: hypothetical protein ACYTEQ_01425 [Planctomycetota bacterium]|jgi:hypothetical protein